MTSGKDHTTTHPLPLTPLPCRHRMPAPSRLEEPQCSQGSRPMRTISSSHRKHAPPPPNPRPCLPCWVTQQHQHHAIPTELGITTTTTTITTNHTSNNNTSAVFMWGRVGGNATHSTVAIESASLDLKRDAKKRRLKARSKRKFAPSDHTIEGAGGGGAVGVALVLLMVAVGVVAVAVVSGGGGRNQRQRTHKTTFAGALSNASSPPPPAPLKVQAEGGGIALALVG